MRFPGARSSNADFRHRPPGLTGAHLPPVIPSGPEAGCSAARRRLACRKQPEMQILSRSEYIRERRNASAVFMRRRSKSVLAAAAITAAFVANGCSSLGSGPADPAAYSAMDCAELNDRMRSTSSEISRTAITRGKVENTSVQHWIPGGTKVATAVADRQTKRIESLRDRERIITESRTGNCRN